MKLTGSEEIVKQLHHFHAKGGDSEVVIAKSEVFREAVQTCSILRYIQIWPNAIFTAGQGALTASVKYSIGAR